MILIIIKFGELFLRIFPRTINALTEDIANTLKSVSSDIQTLYFEVHLKTSTAPRFFNPFLSVWIFDETLFHVFDKLLNTISTKTYILNLTVKGSTTLCLICLWKHLKSQIAKTFRNVLFFY